MLVGQSPLKSGSLLAQPLWELEVAPLLPHPQIGNIFAKTMTVRTNAGGAMVKPIEINLVNLTSQPGKGIPRGHDVDRGGQNEERNNLHDARPYFL